MTSEHINNLELALRDDKPIDFQEELKAALIEIKRLRKMLVYSLDENYAAPVCC